MSSKDTSSSRGDPGERPCPGAPFPGGSDGVSDEDFGALVLMKKAATWNRWLEESSTQFIARVTRSITVRMLERE
jgi:hypothetical protein